MLMDGAQAEQAAHPGEKQCQLSHHYARGALETHHADPLARRAEWSCTGELQKPAELGQRQP